jgi:DUF4097 and DUF4098 domain-containing protein YvlB
MAIKAHITIDQGANYSTSIDVTDDAGDPVDLTGYTGAAQMRKHYTSTNAHSFTVSIANASGVVTLSMNAAVTGNISPGRYVYDCELTDGDGTVSRLIEGIVTITPQVTR